MKFSKKSVYILIFISSLIAIGILSYFLIYNILAKKRIREIEENICRYTEIIWKYSQEYAVPTELVKSIIRIESKGDPRVVSDRNAFGLMQVTKVAEKDVIERFSIKPDDLLDPDYNIHVGVAYLRILYDKFDNHISYILAAYHAGPSKVMEWRDKMPSGTPEEVIRTYAYDETKMYIDDILK